MSPNLIYLSSSLIIPPSRSSLRRAKLVLLILSVSKIIPTYSRCVEKGLVYIAIASPTGR